MVTFGTLAGQKNVQTGLKPRNRKHRLRFNRYRQAQALTSVLTLALAPEASPIVEPLPEFPLETAFHRLVK